MSGPWAFVNQDLVSHSLNTAKIAEKIVDESYKYSIVRRIRVASRGKVDIDENKVLELIKIAALLHDIGKAADEYQLQFEKKFDEPSFSYHELPSVFIAYNLMEKMGYLNHEKALIFLTILNSHQAMRSPIEEAYKCKIKKWSFRKWWNGTKPIFNSLKIEKHIFDLIGEDIRDLTIRNINDQYKMVTNYARRIENANLVKLYCLFLAPVTWGDICDASAFRPKDKHLSRFREELLEVCV
jgi:CRISPR-associated endonuclease Cas3-HD